jgi:hypothetical protein
MAKKKLKLKARVDEYGGIRLYDRTGGTYCPLTAVAQSKYNEYYGVSYVMEAGKRMGLSKPLIHTIVEAADQHDPTNGMRLTMFRRLGLKK